MGLKLKDFETPDGTIHPVTYWVVQHIDIHSPKHLSSVHIDFAGWANQAAHDAGKARIGTKTIILNVEDVEAFFPAEIMDQLVTKAYGVAKTHATETVTEPIDPDDPEKGTREKMRSFFDKAEDVLDAASVVKSKSK